MNEEIKISKLTDYEGGGYLAEYTHLKGCMADGETKIEALEELEKAKEFKINYKEKIKYKRISVSFPETLLHQLDKALKDDLHITRSAFFQQSVYKSLNL